MQFKKTIIGIFVFTFLGAYAMLPLKGQVTMQVGTEVVISLQKNEKSNLIAVVENNSDSQIQFNSESSIRGVISCLHVRVKNDSGQFLIQSSASHDGYWSPYLLVSQLSPLTNENIPLKLLLPSKSEIIIPIDVKKYLIGSEIKHKQVREVALKFHFISNGVAQTVTSEYKKLVDE